MTGAIAQLLASDPGDPTTLSEAAFLDWLTARFCHALRDEGFRLRLDLRATWLDHPELLEARARLSAAEQADRATPEHEALEQTARSLRGAEQAVEGLTMAVLEGRIDDETKLVQYEQEVEALKADLARQQAQSPTHASVTAARKAVDALLASTDVEEKRSSLRALQKARGRGASHAGRRFEDRGAATIEARLFPTLRAQGHDPRLLRGVTLGCARGEWDGLIVEAAALEPAVVLGMVEFKRNPNDLAHGFVRRQENLAWLQGEIGGYEPSLYRTQRYPEGHFRGPVTEAGLTFTRESFAGLARDPGTGHVLEGLHFVTVDRPLTGLSSGDQQRLLGRIAGNLTLDWSDPAAVVKTVRSWLDPDTLRTAEVLTMFRDAGLSNNVRFAIETPPET